MAFNQNQPRDKNGRWSPVGAYISEEGFEMNNLARQGYGDEDDRITGLDAIIEKQKTPYNGPLYRGMDNQFTEWAEIETNSRFDDNDLEIDDLVGIEFTDAAFSSVSTDADLALDFATRGTGRGTYMVITKSTNSLDVSDVMGADVNWQEERILPRNTTFKITSAKTMEMNGNDILYLEAEAY